MTHCVVTSSYFQGFQLSRRSFSGVQGTFAFTQMQMHVARTATSSCLSNGISRELSFRALRGTLFFYSTPALSQGIPDQYCPLLQNTGCNPT